MDSVHVSDVAGARLVRFALDSDGRCAALFAVDKPTVTGAVNSAGHKVCIVLEPCALAATVADGLLPPRRCLITNLTAKLRPLGALLLHFRKSIIVAAKSYFRHQSVNFTWFDDYVDGLLSLRQRPLNWSDDAADIANAWVRSMMMSADPLIPGLEAVDEMAVDAHGLSSTAQLGRHGVTQRSAGVPIAVNGVRAPFDSVIYWTPQYMVINDGADGRSCCGVAYTCRSPASGHARTLTSTAPSAAATGAGAGPDPDRHLPDIRVYHFTCDHAGYFTFQRLPQAFNSGPEDADGLLRALQAAGVDPAGAAAVAGDRSSLAASDSTIHPFDTCARRLLADAQQLDPRAAHEPSIRIAAIMKAANGGGAGGVKDEGDEVDIIESRLGPEARTLHWQLVPHINAQGSLRRAAWTCAHMVSIGHAVATKASIAFPPHILPSWLHGDSGLDDGGSTDIDSGRRGSRGTEASGTSSIATGDYSNLYASTRASSLTSHGCVAPEVAERYFEAAQDDDAFRLTAVRLAAARALKRSEVMMHQLAMTARATAVRLKQLPHQPVNVRATAHNTTAYTIATALVKSIIQADLQPILLSAARVRTFLHQ